MKKHAPKAVAALAIACGLALAPVLSAEATYETFTGTIYGTGVVTNYSTPRYHAAGSINISLSKVGACGGTQYLWLRNSSTGARISKDASWGGTGSRTMLNTSGGLSIPGGTFKISGINSGDCIPGSDYFTGGIVF